VEIKTKSRKTLNVKTSLKEKSDEKDSEKEIPKKVSSFPKIKKNQIIIFVAVILIIGILLLVLPGPAFIVIPVGLGILATEFEWAKNILEKVKQKIKNRNR